MRFVCLALALATVAEAATETRQASEYVRVLEAGPPSAWDAAAGALLVDDGKLDRYAVSSVVRRIDSLEWDTRLRAVRALERYPHTLDTMWRLARTDPHPDVRAAAMDSLLHSRAPGLMDICRDLIELNGPNPMEALETLVNTFAYWLVRIEDDTDDVIVDPVLAPENGTPDEIFDRRYLDTASQLLFSPDALVRAAALATTSSIDTPGLRDAWLALAHDTDPSVRWQALWTLAEAGDPRACPILFDELTEEDDVKRARIECAPHSFLEYFERYQHGGDVEDVELYRGLIEEGTTYRLSRHREIVDAMPAYVDHPDPFLAETARSILEWADVEAEVDDGNVDVRAGLRPAILIASAFVSVVLGGLLFVWAFRLFALFVRVRNRPISKIASLPLGPVALEGKVQPAGGLIRHPLTDEPCVYYAGADIDHPETRFYLIDDSARALIDPRRAVLFSDDDVLVPGERVHLVGHADRQLGKVVIGKDATTPPLYRRVGHRVIEAFFGFGQKTRVTKMLFTDPSRCFWIWDDLERRPMGEAGDVLWLATSVLLAGAWIVVFAVSVLGMVDQEMSATLAQVIGALMS